MTTIDQIMMLVCGAFCLYLALKSFSRPTIYQKSHWTVSVQRDHWKDGSARNKFEHPLALAAREALEAQGVSVLWVAWQGQTIEVETRDARISLRVPRNLQTAAASYGAQLTKFKDYSTSFRVQSVRLDRPPVLAALIPWNWGVTACCPSTINPSAKSWRHSRIS